MALIAKRIARGAEIQQLDRAVFGNIDVVRRHIAVDQPCSVYDRQCLQHRAEHTVGLLHAYAAAVVCDVIFEADTLDVLHDEIGCAIFVKEVDRAGDIGRTDEARKRPRLVLKAFKAVVKRLLPALHGDADGKSRAPRDLRWQKFLDCDLPSAAAGQRPDT